MNFLLALPLPFSILGMIYIDQNTAEIADAEYRMQLIEETKKYATALPYPVLVLKKK
jgi:hypothetical protein